MTTEEAQSVEVSSEVSETSEVNTADAVESQEQVEPTQTEEAEGVEASEETTQEEEAQADPDDQVFEVVIDGQPVQTTLKEMKKHFGTLTSSHNRFEQAANKLKEAQALEEKTQQWKEKLLQNPFQALMEANLPADAIRQHYEEVVWQLLQQDQMSEEEKSALRQKKESEELKRKYEELLKQQEEEKSRREQEMFEQKVAKQQQSFTESISKGLEEAGVPVTAESIRHVAQKLHTAIQNNYELDISDAVSVYKQDLNKHLMNQLSGLGEDALLEVIGQDRLNKIRKKEINKIQESVPSKPKASSGKKVSKEDLNASNFFDSLKQSIYK